MVSSLRIADTSAETQVAKFLDEHFYPNHVQNFKRYNDSGHQLLGIDVEFDYKGLSKMLVDEKAALHHVNQDLPTFAFEVDFLNSVGNLSEGWLYDDAKATQFYLLVWLWAKKDKNFSAEEITKAEIIIVERKAIINMLKIHQLTKERVTELSKEIRINGTWGKHYALPNRPYFFYSTQLSEKPLNIVIRKKELVKLAIGRHIIEA